MERRKTGRVWRARLRVLDCPPEDVQPDMTTPTAASSDGSGPLTHRDALWIVAGVLPTVFMSSVDQTIVAGTLPTIGREFGATQNLSWIASIYLLTLTATTSAGDVVVAATWYGYSFLVLSLLIVALMAVRDGMFGPRRLR